MTSTVFIDQQTIIQASWLNDVNESVYTTVPGYNATLTYLSLNSVIKSANLSDIVDKSAAVVNLGVKSSANGSLVLPVGTTAERDAGAPTGYLRYNSTLTQFEGYGVAGWGKVGGGATGGGTDAVFYLNGQTITSDYTIPAGQNAGSFGPITIADGITVEIPTGSTWSIT